AVVPQLFEVEGAEAAAGADNGDAPGVVVALVGCRLSGHDAATIAVSPADSGVRPRLRDCPQLAPALVDLRRDEAGGSELSGELTAVVLGVMGRVAEVEEPQLAPEADRPVTLEDRDPDQKAFRPRDDDKPAEKANPVLDVLEHVRENDDVE